MLLPLVAAALGIAIGVGIGLAIRRADRPATVDSPDVSATSSSPAAILEDLDTGVVLCDRFGVITYRNAMARSLAGTHFGVLLDAAIERNLASARTGIAGEELVELYGPPKSTFIVRTHQVDDGSACAFIDDVSDRRRIEAMRTDLVANISHELKTPIGAIAVLAETLVDEDDPDVVDRVAERMLDEAHRAVRTIDDLLELSQIERGGETVSEEVAAGEIVTAAIDRAAPLAEQRGVEIAVPVVSVADVRGDRRQLVSALGNLVENAVKYSEPGGRVDITIRRDGDSVCFEVADQGVGVPVRDLDRIFERFYRVDKARSRGTGGSGLGLAIVRHVATNHGGEVTVSSSEGLGSTFVLRIPSCDTLRSATTDHLASADHLHVEQHIS